MEKSLTSNEIRGMQWTGNFVQEHHPNKDVLRIQRSHIFAESSNVDNSECSSLIVHNNMQ
jgi:hypothetical protein